MGNAKLINAKSKEGGCANAAPGFVKLYLAEQKWLDAVPAREDYFTDPVANEPLTISGDVTFDTVTYTEAGWYEWDLMPETTDYVPSGQGPRGARYWQSTIPLKLAGHDALIDQAVEWANCKKMVALLLDVDGQYRLVGDKTVYLSVNKADGPQGAAAGDFSGWDMELFIPSHKLLFPYYTGAITPIFAV